MFVANVGQIHIFMAYIGCCPMNFSTVVDFTSLSWCFWRGGGV